MQIHNKELETYRGLVKQLDSLLENDKWSKSPALTAIRKELSTLRKQFGEAIDEEEKVLHASKKHLYGHPMRRDEASSRSQQNASAEKVEVFISLYCAQGRRLSQWEKILEGIEKHAVNRPAYRLEGNVQEVIRSKPRPENEAYCTIAVAHEDVQIIPESATPRDRLGHELLQLKEQSIHFDRIVRFVHQGVTYHLNDEGRLVKG